MTNIPIAALGVAVGVLGPVVILLSNARANRPDVYGTAHVSQTTGPPVTGLTGRADLHLVINAHGVQNAVVRLRDPAVPVSRWPDIGATLPVLLPNGNPRRAQVLWDQVRGHHDVATVHGTGFGAFGGQEYQHDDEYDFGYDDPDVVDDPEVEEEEEAVPVGVGTAEASAGTATRARKPSPWSRPRQRGESSPATASVSAPPAGPPSSPGFS